jgi:hypothetical protein
LVVGAKSYGGLGINSTTNMSAPVQVGTATNWQLAVAGSFHSLGKRTDGTLYSWGLNESGTLGDNTLIDRDEPVLLGCPTSTLSSHAFLEDTFVIWPNPVKDFLYIKNGANDIDRVIVTDLLGKVVLEQAGNVTAVNLESLAGGIYLASIFSGNAACTAKFVK